MKGERWIIAAILVSGAVALFAKSAGAAPATITTIVGHRYRFTATFSRALSPTEQALVSTGMAAFGAQNIVMTATGATYDQTAVMPRTITPGQTSVTSGGVTLTFQSVTEVGIS